MHPTLCTHLFPARWERWARWSLEGVSYLSEVTPVMSHPIVKINTLTQPNSNLWEGLLGMFDFPVERCPHHLLFEFQTRPLGCFRLFPSFPVSLLDDRPSRKKKSRGWQIKQNISCSISHHKTKASLIWHNRRRVDKQMLWPFISKKITLHHKECSGYLASDNNREGSPASVIKHVKTCFFLTQLLN